MSIHALIHLLLQGLRRCTQLATLAVVLAIAGMSVYAHYRAAYALEDIAPMQGGKGMLLRLVDRAAAPVRDQQAFFEKFKGTLWSMRLGGMDISDPLAAAELAAASKTLPRSMLLSVLLPVVATLLLGRIFCSWICPGSLLFETAGKLRAVLRFAEIPSSEVQFSLINKYAVLLTGLAVAAILSQPLFALIYPPAVISRLMHAWLFGTAVTGMALLLLVIVAVELFVSPRWWCRTMCPGGALYALIGWPRLLRVRLSQSLCNQCGKCDPVCEPGISPVTDSEGIECTNCGKCVQCCPEKALRYTLAAPLKKNRQGPTSSPPARILLSLLCFFFLNLSLHVSPAFCHHVLGLPHYSYKENYPQVPTLEYPATSGPYSILLTSLPGKFSAGEHVSVSFYIKEQVSGAPYCKPVRVRVLQTFTFGDSREILVPTFSEPFEQPLMFAVTYPEDGEYIIELSMDVEGKQEVIPFVIIAGEPSAAVSVLITVGALLLVFIIVVRAVKIKRSRRRAHA